MMNIDDEDVNLGLALGSTTYSIKTRLRNSSGAGANADSRVDMAFAASDPLSELVWSPHNGLSLKRANPSVADKKPFLLWNVGPSTSTKDLSPSQSIRSKGRRDDNAVDQENLMISRTVLDADDLLCDEATFVRPSRSSHTPELGAIHGDYDGKSNRIMEEEGGTKDAIPKKENCLDDEEDLCRPQNVQIAGIAVVSKKDDGLNTSADGISDCEVDTTVNRLFATELIRKSHCIPNSNIQINDSNTMDLEAANCSEPVATNLSEALIHSLPNLQSEKKPDDEVTSASGKSNKNKIDISFPIPAPPLKKLESSAENDLCHLTAEETGETNSRVCLYREKGKEKALSDGDICGRSSNSEDDSQESVESCNSAGLFSKGIKRQRYDQELILGNKKMKKQTMDSSFMNWISNMVKGLSNTVKEDSSSLALTLACPNDVYGKNHQEDFTRNKTHDSAVPNTGFQTIFQSLYCRNLNISNTGERKENGSTEESREFMVAEKTSLVNSCKQIVVSEKEVNPIVGQPSKPWIFASNIDCSPYACESDPMENKALGKQMNSTVEKSTPLNSLWITRFSARTPRLEKHDEFTQETNECSTYCPKSNLGRTMNDVFPIDKKSPEARDDTVNAEASVDLKSTSKLCPLLPSEKFRNSEAMASVFARRLDALKHIIPSKRRNLSTCSITCFFCGLSHDLRECPDITKNELEDLLLKMSSFDGVDESSCLCIRCFQLDHWAISCPLAPSSGHLESENNGSFISRYTACHLQLSAAKRVSTPNEIGRSTRSNLANDVTYHEKIPVCNIVAAKNTVAPSEIFHAIRNLRLSRSDILRWMNSNVSLSYLNGFFLRLRLGNMEEGLGGTSYYVACITGDAREHNGCRSKKSILVDVGGIKSSVGSQFISNHDFLEDEIKAWWCRTMDSGCKIPSFDELNSKLNDRKSLGF